MKAYELKAIFEAGLQLCGQEEDGSLQFLGTKEQWQRAFTTIKFNSIWK